MKILKIVLGVLALLLLIFILIGFIVPGVSYSSEVTVNKPASEAWSVMSDENKLSQWITGYKRSELISGTPNTVGTVSNIYIENQGTESVIEETVTELVPNKVMAMDFSMDPMDMDYRMTFEEKDGKTVIKSTTDVKGNGMMMRSMMALMKGGMQSQEDINMGKLQKLINENTEKHSAG